MLCPFPEYYVPPPPPRRCNQEANSNEPAIGRLLVNEQLDVSVDDERELVLKYCHRSAEGKTKNYVNNILSNFKDLKL